MIWRSNLSRGKIFSQHQNIQTSSATFPALYSMVMRSPFSEQKQPGRVADHLPPSSAATPQLHLHALMVRAGTNLPLYNMHTSTVLLWLDNPTYQNLNNLKQQWSTVTRWPDLLPIIFIYNLSSATTMIMAVLWMHKLTSVYTVTWYSKIWKRLYFL